MNSLRAVAPVAASSKVLQKNDVIDELLASCSTCSSSKNEMRTIFVGEFYNYSANFAQALGFWQFLTKKCVIFDKSEKSDSLAESFQVWHSKSHENLPRH